TEYGVRKVQGKRTDLHNICDEITTGSTLRDIALDHPTTYIRNYRGIRDFMCVASPPQPRKVTVKALLEGDELPVGPDVYYYYVDTRPYPYHSQTVCVFNSLGDLDKLQQQIVSGFPCCINDTPCRIISVFVAPPRPLTYPIRQ
ncbi:hypothetical protein I619_15544, partial [Listeria monocytogenes SHL010]